MSELRECPACGSDAKFDWTRETGCHAYISCSNLECRLEGPHSKHNDYEEQFDYKQEAVALWDSLPRRSDREALLPLVQFARAVLHYLNPKFLSTGKSQDVKALTQMAKNLGMFNLRCKETPAARALDGGADDE